MTVTFDDSLPKFTRALMSAGVDTSGGVVVRDSRGRLLFVASSSVAEDVLQAVADKIDTDLLPYVSPLGPITGSDSPGAGSVLGDESVLWVDVFLPPDETQTVKLLDRRTVGADWLHRPTEPAASPPRLVFASLKGGVGRSTALSVLTAELASRGHSLLIVDLDMEAPGIGSMLVEPEAVPRFGSIDFFVENGIQNIDDSFLLDCIGSSWLGGGRGRIDVVPAFGANSLNQPATVLSKLARAYLETHDDNGTEKTFLSHLVDLVQRLTSLSRYDAVLIDTRAGLHETTAAPLLGLGADVLLFGVDQAQTISGYDALLSHLAQFPRPSPDNDWRYRLKMVQGKAIPSEQSLDHYRARTFDLFDRIFYQHEINADIDILGAGYRFGIDDNNAPHFPVPVFDDDHYRLFDPLQNRGQLISQLYKQSFGSFVDFCIERLQLDEDVVP